MAQLLTDSGSQLTFVTAFGKDATDLGLSRLLMIKIGIAACALGSLNAAVTEIGRLVTGFDR
jgi:uncharacterized ferredoxin-like protein